jgi:ubiquinone biosynthesis monooxygenase Coq7
MRDACHAALNSKLKRSSTGKTNGPRLRSKTGFIVGRPNALVVGSQASSEVPAVSLSSQPICLCSMAFSKIGGREAGIGSFPPIADITRRCDEASMAIAARLKTGETLGDRVMKVDHAGEHGAVCIYTAQRWFARWRAPDLLDELDDFRDHERGHRTRFADELAARGLHRCRSYHFCAVGGLALGSMTGLLGRGAIAATTVAIERVVLRHMREQIAALELVDPNATDALRQIIREEQDHHDLSAARLAVNSWWTRIIDPIVAASTEAVIWLGMRL